MSSIETLDKIDVNRGTDVLFEDGAVNPDEPPKGSHVVEFRADGKVVIKDLELFMAFDDRIDDPDDKEIAAVDEGVIDFIFSVTKEHMDRGTMTQMIVEHAPKKGETREVKREAVGKIISMRKGPIEGIAGIFGDVELAREDFDCFVRSNDFPRRSAEIWKNGWMSEIALLGRQSPRRPLPDTNFENPGEKMQFQRDREFGEALNFQAGPGSGNVLVPTTAQTKKPKQLPDIYEDDTMPDDPNDRDKVIEDLKAKLQAALDENKELKAKMKNQADDDDEKKKENTHKDDDKNKDENALIGRRLTAAETRNSELEVQVKKLTFGKDLDQMQHEGFAISKHRDTMLDELCEAKDPDAKLLMWRDTMKEIPLETRLQLTTAHPVLGPGYGAKPDKIECYEDLNSEQQKMVCEKARDRCINEKKQESHHYRTFLDEEVAKLAG